MFCNEKNGGKFMSNLRIVAFGAHPGDPFAAGGTLAKHAKRGDDLVVASLSYGERSHSHAVWEEYEGKEREEYILKRAKEVKRKEMERAAEILGIKKIKIFDFGDSPLIIDKEKLYEVVDFLREFKPDIVLVHTDQGHFDHECAWDIMKSACRIAADLGVKTKNPPCITKNVYYYAPWSLGEECFTPDVFIDIRETIELKIKALAEFKSQKITPQLAREETLSTAWWWGAPWYPAYVEPFKSFRKPILKFLPDPLLGCTP